MIVNPLTRVRVTFVAEHQPVCSIYRRTYEDSDSYFNYAR